MIKFLKTAGTQAQYYKEIKPLIAELLNARTLRDAEKTVLLDTEKKLSIDKKYQDTVDTVKHLVNPAPNTINSELDYLYTKAIDRKIKKAYDHFISNYAGL